MQVLLAHKVRKEKLAHKEMLVLLVRKEKLVRKA
jgi:hypothetical protein